MFLPGLLIALLLVASVGVWGTWTCYNASRGAQRQLEQQQAESRQQLEAVRQRSETAAVQHAAQLSQLTRLSKRVQSRLKISEANRLAALSRTLRGVRPETAVLLAAEAVIGDSSAYPVQTVLEQLNQFGGEPLAGHTSAVTAAVVAPDGRRAVTADRSGKLAVWQLAADSKSLPPDRPFWLEGHQAQVDQLLFTSNGRYVISASADTNLRIWDLESIDPVQFAVILRGHHDAVTAIALAADDRWLLSGGRDGEVRLWRWDASDAAGSSRVILKAPTGILHLGFIGSRAGAQTAVAIDREGTLHQLPALKLEPAGLPAAETESSPAPADSHTAQVELQQLRLRSITAWAHSADREQLALGFADGRVQVLLARGKPTTTRVLENGGGPVSRLAWSPDGEQLAAVSVADGLQLWDIHSAGRLDVRRVQVLSDAVTPGDRLEFCDHGRRLVLVSREKGLCFWLRGQNGLFQRPQMLTVFAGHPTVSQATAASEVLLVGDDQGAVRCWDFNRMSGPALPCLISTASDSAIRMLQVVGDEAAQRGVLLGWDEGGQIRRAPGSLAEPHTPDPEVVESPRAESKSPATAVLAVSPDARWLARLLPDGTLELGPTEAPGHARIIEVSTGSAALEVAQFSTDGRWLALGSADGDVWVVRNEPDSEAPLPARRLGTHTDGVRVVAFDDENRWLAVTGWQPTVTVWPLFAEGEGLERRLTGHVGQVTAIGFRAGTVELWTGGVDASLRRWDLGRPAGSELVEILRESAGGITGLEQLPWLSAVVSCDRSGQLRLWTPVGESDGGGSRTAETRFVSTVLGDLGGVPTAMAVAADRFRVLAACPDQSVRMWTVRPDEPISQPLILPNHGDEVTALKLAADGQTVYCGTRTGRIVGWPLAVAKLADRARTVAGRELTESERQEFAVPLWSAFTSESASTGNSSAPDD